MLRLKTSYSQRLPSIFWKEAKLSLPSAWVRNAITSPRTKKKTCQPFHRNQAEMLCVQAADCMAESHVYRSCVEPQPEEDHNDPTAYSGMDSGL